MGTPGGKINWPLPEGAEEEAVQMTADLEPVRRKHWVVRAVKTVYAVAPQELGIQCQPDSGKKRRKLLQQIRLAQKEKAAMEGEARAQKLG